MISQSVGAAPGCPATRVQHLHSDGHVQLCVCVCVSGGDEDKGHVETSGQHSVCVCDIILSPSWFQSVFPALLMTPEVLMTDKERACVCVCVCVCV